MTYLNIHLQTFPPSKAIQAGLAILLDVRAILRFICRWLGDAPVIQSAKGLTSNSDAIVDLLQSIEHFLNRLDSYTQIPTTPAMDELVVKILVEIISILALVTKELKHQRPSESVLADVLLYSAPRSKTCEEFFQGEGH